MIKTYHFKRMDQTIKNLLTQDFERYMTNFYTSFNRFTLEDFGLFASTILNYYVNNKVIDLEDKKLASYYLTTLYNKGIGNRITEEHLEIIAETISRDTNIDFTVIKNLFG